ncbi:PAAR domain-containing protein [Fluviispira vulneris]|uniref:PAAR domain-containing protein n=1 Tax=Fluviispira vulneris TaxID=2763012 RepID=UPI001645FB46|nr:PAAR domain-containing protein [Fluviispira vulneris]
MKLGIVVQGDSLSSGGVVLPIPRLKPNIMKMPFACLGDKVSCPIPFHGVGTIEEGFEKFKINGMPIALHGHKTSCGCTLVASQFGSKLTIDVPEKTEHTWEVKYKKFIFKDSETSENLQNIQYSIISESGDFRRGYTNESAETKTLMTKESNCKFNLKPQTKIVIE